MSAFGDSLVFLGAFGLAALPVTGVALYFLRPYRTFWRTISIAALVVAASGIVTSMDYVAPAAFQSTPGLRTLMTVASLGIFVAPLFAMLFILSALFATDRFSRRSLLAAAAIEILVCVSVAFVWFGPYRR
jgi:hypothetical protein